jgi:hypothetical protein
MEDPSPSDPTATLVPSELRHRVESTCAESRIQRARSVVADTSLREARHAATAAHASLDAALAMLDERRLTEHKDQARRSYRMALTVARDAGERQQAAATWLRRIDDLNRSSRGALGQVLLLRARCEALDQAVRDASMESNIQRVRTEAAEAACTEARRLLAEHDRWASGPDAVTSAPGTWSDDTIETEIDDASPAAITPGSGDPDRPLAIELLLDGDATVSRQLARQMSDLTGQQPSRCLLLLQGLAEAIVQSAIDHGHLRFDSAHPLWAQLSAIEARALTSALRDLGFRYDPNDGWYGERAPQARDLALALKYAGMDAHVLRQLSTTEDLLDLPSSIAVAPFEHLAEMAPDLGLDDVHRVAGRTAPELADLWDHWADVRALLLGPAAVAVEA